VVSPDVVAFSKASASSEVRVADCPGGFFCSKPDQEWLSP
jgi:hypothetical protein